MSTGVDADRHDWGPWVLVPKDGRPYHEPDTGRDIVYRPRLIAPEHPTLRVAPGYIGGEWQFFDLDDYIDAPKVLRQLVGLSGFTADDRALAGFLYAVADSLDWWTEPSGHHGRGGWYGKPYDDDPVTAARNRGWDRLAPADYDWVEPERPWPPRPEWGEWALDDDAMILDGAKDRTVDLLACRTAESIMQQLLSLAPSVEHATLGGLIRAIDDVLSPGSWRRPFGADQGIGIDEVAERVSHHVGMVRHGREQPEWAKDVLMAATVSPVAGAELVGAWRPRVVDAITARELPCLRVDEQVRVRAEDLREWAARPDTDLGMPADLAEKSERWKRRQESEDVCAKAAWKFLSFAAPWTGTQAELHAAITPDPQPPEWPTAAQLVNLLGRQYHPHTGRSRTRTPRRVYDIENVGKRRGRNLYRISVLPKSG